MKRAGKYSRDDALAVLRFLYGDQLAAEHVLGLPAKTLSYDAQETWEAVEAHLDLLHRERDTALACCIVTIQTLRTVYAMLDDNRLDDARETIALSQERILRRYLAPLQDIAQYMSRSPHESQDHAI